jgi:hypothetical protein
VEPTRAFRVTAYAFLRAMGSGLLALIAAWIDSLGLHLIAVLGVGISIGFAAYGVLLMFRPDKSD